MTNQTRRTAARTLAAFSLAGFALMPGQAAAQADDTPELAGGPDTYSEDEIITAVAGFFGTTAKAAGTAVERIFQEHGRPSAYIAGEEGSASVTVGLRYGAGLLYLKAGGSRRVYWQGPSVGFDLGANASKVFTLAYNLRSTDDIFRRFPGVEGSAYFVGGIGVNYQRADGITLAPMRAGVGLRAGANVGYLAYSRRRNWLPF